MDKIMMIVSLITGVCGLLFSLYRIFAWLFKISTQIKSNNENLLLAVASMKKEQREFEAVVCTSLFSLIDYAKSGNAENLSQRKDELNKFLVHKGENK